MRNILHYIVYMSYYDRYGFFLGSELRHNYQVQVDKWMERITMVPY